MPASPKTAAAVAKILTLELSPRVGLFPYQNDGDFVPVDSGRN
jgi:hypothetical protein